MTEHAGSGACIRFVDEREFKEVSVADKHRVRKNRPSGYVLEPNCVERSSESLSEDDEVDCSSELEIESDESETETQGSCSCSSKPTNLARKAKNNLTEDEVDSM